MSVIMLVGLPLKDLMPILFQSIDYLFDATENWGVG